MKTDHLFCAALVCSIAIAAPAPLHAQNGSANPLKGGSNAQTTSAAGVAKSDVPDGVTRMNGKTFFIKNGRATVVDNELKLSEGMIVRPTGEVQLRDGRKLQLEDQQLITLEGELKKLPLNANLQQHSGTTSTTGQGTQGTITNPIRPTPTGQGGDISLGGTGPSATRDKSFEQKETKKGERKKSEERR